MIDTIIIDFGHGGIDNVGKYTTAPSKMFTFDNGDIAYEGKLNREIGKYVLDYLKELKGLNIETTVGVLDSKDISLKERVLFANTFNPLNTIFISIHCNAGGGTGYEIFTSKGQTKGDHLATKITDSVKNLYKREGLPIRRDYSDGDIDKEANFYVLRKTKCPAVLIECGFFDNKKDFKLLGSAKFQKELGTLIGKGIQSYLNE